MPTEREILFAEIDELEATMSNTAQCETPTPAEEKLWIRRFAAAALPAVIGVSRSEVDARRVAADAAWIGALLYEEIEDMFHREDGDAEEDEGGPDGGA